MARTEVAAAGAASARASLRRLRRVSLMAPTALVLVLVGPSIAAVDASPLPAMLGQPLLAGLGAILGLVAVYDADGCDDLPTVADQNLRLLMLMLALVSIAIAGAWLWLGAMNLIQWVVAGP